MKIDGLLQYMAMKIKPDVPAIHCVAINTEAKVGSLRNIVVWIKPSNWPIEVGKTG